VFYFPSPVTFPGEAWVVETLRLAARARLADFGALTKIRQTVLLLITGFCAYTLTRGLPFDSLEAASVKGVVGVHDMRAEMIGGQVHLEMHIEFPEEHPSRKQTVLQSK
jgi:hypothetical protein